MKPVILISRGISPAGNYINAIEDAGGLGEDMYLPEYDERYSGLLLAGGGDIHPSRFNEERLGSYDIDAERDSAEFNLIDKFLDADKPIFGICRGAQIINVYFGGALIQDLPEPHAAIHRLEKGDALHLTQPISESPLHRIFGPEFMTNSSHHQAIKRLGNDIVSVQKSNDGIIEGIRHKRHMIFGVQWHPERMCSGHRRDDAPDMLPLFRRFLNICTGSNEILV